MYALTGKNAVEAGMVEHDLQIKTPPGYPLSWIHCVFTISRQKTGRSVIIEGVAFNITRRVLAEKEASYQAEHDQLTGLLNRHGAERVLTVLLTGLKRSETVPVIFLIDLDGFKKINDTLGHDAGDRVLVEVSRRLLANCRASDWVIRWGGDEFMVVSMWGGKQEGLRSFADKLIRAVAQPIQLEGQIEQTVGCSIGIAWWSPGINNVKDLIKQADTAMYAVKGEGKNGYCLYDPGQESLRVEKVFQG
jgi:diguanylate cyclase (GGDEF)-like protein